MMWRLLRSPGRATVGLRRYHELCFTSTGHSPSEVLEYRRSVEPPAPINETSRYWREPWVRVEIDHAPWNPADMNTVQGRYASPYTGDQAMRMEALRQSTSATVAGSEGMGRVVALDTDEATSLLQVGDWVTFGLSGLGTMRSSLSVPASMLIKIDRGDQLVDDLGSASASTLFQLGGTAIRLLRDFFDDPSATVIQNAGNSGVGFMVSQLVHSLYPDARIVSLVRRSNRSSADYDKLAEYLTGVGQNDLVVAEEDLEDRSALGRLKEQLAEMERPARLALNAVGGQSATILTKLLAPSSTMVTYGGMSAQPITIATPQLIFQDLRVRGYWHSRWMTEHSHTRKTQMVNELVDLVLDRGLQCPPVEVFPLVDYTEALAFDASQSSKPIRSKVVFDCRE